MNKNASLTPVQGPSTVVCMIVTSLSQLPHWLHQLPTVGKGQWQAPSYELSFCCNSRSKGKTQPYYWLATDCLSPRSTKAWVGGWGAVEKQWLGLLLSSTIPCVFFTCNKKEIAIRRKGRWWVIRQWEGGRNKLQIDRGTNLILIVEEVEDSIPSSVIPIKATCVIQKDLLSWC
jgi:hypothetical protein